MSDDFEELACPTETFWYYLRNFNKWWFDAWLCRWLKVSSIGRIPTDLL